MSACVEFEGHFQSKSTSCFVWRPLLANIVKNLQREWYVDGLPRSDAMSKSMSDMVPSQSTAT